MGSVRTTSDNNFIRGLSRKGKLFDIALFFNRLQEQPSGVDRSQRAEFAGSTFSPDGRPCFVDIQSSARDDVRGVWGPWRETV